MTDLAPARLVAPWWRRLWARLTGRDVELVQQLKLEALTRINVELKRELEMAWMAYYEVALHVPAIDGPIAMPTPGDGVPRLG